jgi:hypothetical protein
MDQHLNQAYHRELGGINQYVDTGLAHLAAANTVKPDLRMCLSHTVNQSCGVQIAGGLAGNDHDPLHGNLYTADLMISVIEEI